MEQSRRTGMSKGCLVALIVGIALLVIIIIGGITCWIYWEDFLRMGGSKSLGAIKQSIATNPPEGLDTAQFNALVDSFELRFDQDSLDVMKYSVFMQTVQEVASDEVVTAEEADRVAAAISEYYPDLVYEGRAEEYSDSVLTPDSVLSQ